MKKNTVEEITREFLKNNGFQGLASSNGCGCMIDDDFMTCGEVYPDDCEAAYRIRCKGEECSALCESGPDSAYCLTVEKPENENDILKTLPNEAKTNEG